MIYWFMEEEGEGEKTLPQLKKIQERMQLKRKNPKKKVINYFINKINCKVYLYQ